MNIQKSLLTVTEYIHFFKKRQEEESFLVCLIRLYFGSPLSFLAMRLYEDEEEYGIGTKAEGRLEMALVRWKGKGEPALYMAVKAVGVSEGF